MKKPGGNQSNRLVKLHGRIGGKKLELAEPDQSVKFIRPFETVQSVSDCPVTHQKPTKDKPVQQDPPDLPDQSVKLIGPVKHQKPTKDKPAQQDPPDLPDQSVKLIRSVKTIQ